MRFAASAELLAAKGPIGPYTSVSDAARYATAVVHWLRFRLAWACRRQPARQSNR